ncbi:glycosyltransferase family 2 protein [Candidatus Woesearchaeota archaeon]|nr:glycosyltransferase family 2 protein [Candidatus Woesearchaeota archaeon]
MINVYFSEVVLAIVYFAALYYNVFWLLTLLEKKEINKKHWKILPSISVLIPAYNEEDSIKETIKSVLNLDYPKDKLKIIVINDGSTDNTKEIVENLIKQNSNLILINQKNGGKANALNNALKQIDSEFIATLDADSFVIKDTLKNLLPYFCDKEIAAVLPSMKIKDPKNVLQRIQRIEYTINTFFRMLNERSNCIHVTPGPFSLYRTSVLKKLNGFDENCITEDLELAVRIQKNNYKILQTYDAEVYTLPPKTIKGLFYQRKRWYKGGFLACLKHKDLMFNKNYGDFGFMRMPSILILPFLSIIMFLTLANDIKSSIFRVFNHLSMVDFDILTIIKNFEFNYHLLDLKFVNVSIVLISILMSIVIAIYAHKLINEKISKYGNTVKSLLYYMFIHPLFLAIVFIVVTYSAIFDKNYKWYSAGKRK